VLVHVEAVSGMAATVVAQSEVVTDVGASSSSFVVAAAAAPGTLVDV